MDFLEGIKSFVSERTNEARANPSRTLAEQLGWAPDSRLLIVTCNDLGSSGPANDAIERAMREGIATSASLMVPAPSARDAAKRCRDLDIGVHLTLTLEYPTYRWRSLTGAPSSHDPDGSLSCATAIKQQPSAASGVLSPELPAIVPK